MRLSVLIAGALLLIPPTAEAAGSVRLRPVATGVERVYADGERFAAWDHGSGWTAIDDRGSTRELDLTCNPNHAVLGSGYLLVKGCVGSSLRPQGGLQVHDLRTGAVHAGARPGDWNPDTFGGDFEASFYGIGARWAEVSTGGNHWAARMFYDWRTGRIVRDDEAETVFDNDPEALFPDLDSRELYRPLCDPLMRIPAPQSALETSPAFLDTPFNGSLMLVRSDNRMRLWRCGREQPVVVGKCEPNGCLTAQLSRAHLTWAEGRSIKVRVLRSRRTYRARAPTTYFDVVHTGRRLFVLDRGQPYAIGDGTLYVGRLPRGSRTRRS